MVYFKCTVGKNVTNSFYELCTMESSFEVRCEHGTVHSLLISNIFCLLNNTDPTILYGTYTYLHTCRIYILLYYVVIYVPIMYEWSYVYKIHTYVHIQTMHKH